MHFAVDGAQRNMIYQTGEAEAQVSWLRVHTIRNSCTVCVSLVPRPVHEAMFTYACTSTGTCVLHKQL